MSHDNLLGIPETRLPEDPAAARLDEGVAAADVAAAHPTSSLAWAVLAESALDEGRTIEGYAYARVGYHRGLDALRASGVMDAMTAGAVTAEDMPQTSLDEALATPQEIEPDPSAGRTPGTRPAGEADGNAVGH